MRKDTGRYLTLARINWSMAEPILKWAGGKRQLLTELRARFPHQFDGFHEPMFGGGALFFHLEPEEATINDTNVRLINFYQQVRDRPEELIERCRQFRPPQADTDPSQEFSDRARDGTPIENFYYQQRELFNRRPNGEDFDELEEAALLLYLNRTCFNGLYRENGEGEFNVPIGDHKNLDWVRASQVREASKILQQVTLLNDDFSYIVEHAQEGDLVYFDPPYEPMSPTANFTEYHQDGFDREDQKRLLEIAAELRDKGVHVVLSNSGILADMYRDADFHVETVDALRSINSDAENRSGATEVIATSVPEEERQGAMQTTLSEE